jgi:hypothetical protein
LPVPAQSSRKTQVRRITRSAKKMNPARDKILWALDKEDYRALFIEGGCQFYALVLNEKLQLPLFYECFPGQDAHSHVFVMKDGLCFDYDGKKEMTFIATTYGGWPNVPPRPVAPEEIQEENLKRGVSDLETRVLRIARSEFEKRKCLYE